MLLLVLKLNFSIGQDAPSKLGLYIVGKTTYTDFITINGYTGNDRNIIATNDELFNAKEDENQDYFISSTIYELKPDYAREVPTNQHMILSNDSTVTYFINQLDFETYCVNNVFLTFYQDTLVEITYNGSEKVKKILLDKYKNKGVLRKPEFSKSLCGTKDKKGKTLRDERLTLSFADTENDIFTALLLFLNFDRQCTFYQYITVRIFKLSQFSSIFNYGLRYKKENEYLYLYEQKRIKEKEKESL